jgi:hypothetical protein
MKSGFRGHSLGGKQSSLISYSMSYDSLEDPGMNWVLWTKKRKWVLVLWKRTQGWNACFAFFSSSSFHFWTLLAGSHHSKRAQWPCGLEVQGWEGGSGRLRCGVTTRGAGWLVSLHNGRRSFPSQ